MSSSSPPPRRRRPRGSLSRDLILDAAEAVARADGFGGLTLRAVAARLEAVPMALYRHFATKDALVNALLDRVLGRFEPDRPTDDWVTDLAAFARGHRRVLDRHPWALAGLFSHPSPGPNATRIGEALLAILARAQFDSDAAVATFSGLLALNYGWSAFASARELQPEVAAAQVREAMAQLDWADFPHTAAVAAEMADYGNDRHYEMVLAQLVHGIRRAAEAQ